MTHFLDYMDNIYEKTILNIKNEHNNWEIASNFVVYNEIIPVEKDIDFKTKFQLKKNDKRTKVLFQQEFNRRKTKYYLSEYDIVQTLIYIYDNFEAEGNAIYLGMCNLIKNKGKNVSFKINSKQFTFKGIKYLRENKTFLTHFDYQIGINDFIGLLNLVIEKDRYNKANEHDKGTILKYLVFLWLFSERTTKKHRLIMKKILKSKKLFRGSSDLAEYKSIINKTGKDKLFFETSLADDILCYNNYMEES